MKRLLIIALCALGFLALISCENTAPHSAVTLETTTVSQVSDTGSDKTEPLDNGKVQNVRDQLSAYENETHFLNCKTIDVPFADGVEWEIETPYGAYADEVAPLIEHSDAANVVSISACQAISQGMKPKELIDLVGAPAYSCYWTGEMLKSYHENKMFPLIYEIHLTFLTETGAVLDVALGQEYTVFSTAKMPTLSFVLPDTPRPVVASGYRVSSFALRSAQEFFDLCSEHAAHKGEITFDMEYQSTLIYSDEGYVAEAIFSKDARVDWYGIV